MSSRVISRGAPAKRGAPSRQVAVTPVRPLGAGPEVPPSGRRAAIVDNVTRARPECSVDTMALARKLAEEQ